MAAAIAGTVLAAVGPEVLKAIASKLGPFVQNLIHRAQDVFGPDKGTGQQNEQKQSTVLATALAALTELIKSGQVPALPDGTASPIVTMLIELLVRMEKANGNLPASAPAVPTVAGLGPNPIPLGTNASVPFTLAPGSRITFEVTVK